LGHGWRRALLSAVAGGFDTRNAPIAYAFGMVFQAFPHTCDIGYCVGSRQIAAPMTTFLIAQPFFFGLYVNHVLPYTAKFDENVWVCGRQAVA
jgi:hypothetical protein